ncbi:hypothetical protein A2Y83_04165 [Candidatus Falkowbacteria bacterium RBG_13_39_14]|uniref:Glycosyl transferase family 1 n=1 Tax=Candidatus Falkowbacteria bacterium RBG_13_39_14 TaxID=1797985 RepID=A0A1F5S362_9BACT|nr:MAG: hypothetical protein A2Y83_04165 [Candidatus Falkowbacteria bacterium RBG_13_39_14]
MRIYFIGQKGIPAKFGGIERHVEDLSVRLAEMGHEVFVYTRPNYTKKELTEYRGVKLISIPSISTKHLDAITHTIRACFDLAKRDADIGHFHSIGPSSLIWLAKLLQPRTPIVSTFHTKCYLHAKWGIFAKIYLKFGEWTACKLADKTITVSHSLTKYAKGKYQTRPCYIPNGVSVPSDDTAGLSIKRWGLNRGGYMLVVSRLIGHKGIHYLIDAYKKIKTDKKLVITGDGAHTNDYVERLKKMAQGNSDIIFTGNQTGIVLQELYRNAYIFVQPSESEGLSIALLEAMAYGNAVIISDIPENIEAASKLGITFRSGDADDLKEKLEYILERPDLVFKLGSLGRKRVERCYNWNNIARETVKVYEEIIMKKLRN